MPLTPSRRPNREWPGLFLAVAVVAAAAVALHRTGLVPTDLDVWATWTPQRLGRLLVGPEQLACYTCTLWAAVIFRSRYGELWRQRRAFAQGLLPTDEGARILPEDARPLLRKLDLTVERQGPSILATMIRLGLGKFAVSRSAAEVSEVVRAQSDLELGRLATGLSTLHYLAWAVPAIGFLGTVRGLAAGLSLASGPGDDSRAFLDSVARAITVAFDTTFVALALSLVLMYFLHQIQRDEETLVLDCQQFCQEHLVLRLYDPSPDPADA